MVCYSRLRPLIPKSIKLIVLKSIDSTNNYAMKLVKKGCESDAVIIAYEQSKGKGTRGRSFFSPNGKGLYISLLLHIKRGIDVFHPPTPAVAVAVKRAIVSHYGLKPKIKWVNDILLDNRKLCGVLVETTLKEREDVVLIIGVGINIISGSLPVELKGKTAALDEFTNIGRIEEFAGLLFDEIFRLLTSSVPDDYMEEYKRDSTVLGRDIRFTVKGKSINGKARDITDKGHLVVDTCDGEVTLLSGDVSIISV